MIARIWSGKTLKANAKKYEDLLKNEVFPDIIKMKIKGFQKISLLKREIKNGVEFMTIMEFKNLESIKEFAGEDYEKSYVPDKAKILSGYDKKSNHYDVAIEINHSF